jgi:hypothetical protein
MAGPYCTVSTNYRYIKQHKFPTSHTEIQLQPSFNNVYSLQFLHYNSTRAQKMDSLYKAAPDMLRSTVAQYTTQVAAVVYTTIKSCIVALQSYTIIFAVTNLICFTLVARFGKYFAVHCCL